jgi:hypothetical protein
LTIKLIVRNLTSKSNVQNLTSKDHSHDTFQMNFIFVLKNIWIIFEILKLMEDKMDTCCDHSCVNLHYPCLEIEVECSLVDTPITNLHILDPCYAPINVPLASKFATKLKNKKNKLCYLDETTTCKSCCQAWAIQNNIISLIFFYIFALGFSPWFVLGKPLVLHMCLIPAYGSCTWRKICGRL